MVDKKSRSIIHKLWFRVLVVLIVTFVLVLSVSRLYTTGNVKAGAASETFTTYLDERIPSLMQAYQIPGVSIALVKEGKTLWANAYGYADLETGRKMTPDTYCRVQSISKPVTAWGVMKLAEQGYIDLDEPAKHYIKNWEFPPSSFPIESVTVRQLLSHTSGMPLGDVFTIYSPRESVPSLQESLSKEAVLFQEPGLSFSYSNSGFNLLELIIEEVTGRDFAEYMEQEILIPLGMHNSSFNWREDFAVPVGYGLTGKAVPPYVYPEKASGGLFASVEDIAAFTAAGTNHEQQVLSVQGVNELYTPIANELGMYSLVFDAYGLGHYIENLPDGKIAVSHGGQGTGIMTHFHFVPATGDGIVILTNSQRSWPFIAYILSDWANWSGFSSVGMSRIILGKYILWSFIGLILCVVLLQLWRLAEGMYTKIRGFAPLSKRSRLLRFTQFGLFVILGAGLLLWLSQEYSFISSVFPIASSWLSISIFAFAVAQLLSALFPRKDLSRR